MCNNALAKYIYTKFVCVTCGSLFDVHICNLLVVDMHIYNLLGGICFLQYKCAQVPVSKKSAHTRKAYKECANKNVYILWVNALHGSLVLMNCGALLWLAIWWAVPSIDLYWAFQKKSPEHRLTILSVGVIWNIYPCGSYFIFGSRRRVIWNIFGGGCVGLWVLTEPCD